MNHRREFLRQSTVLSLTPMIPAFLETTARATDDGNTNGRALVVIQLSGGNDGINTIVPIHDDGYAEHRKDLRLAKKDLIQLNENTAFHPRLRSASELFQDDRLSVVHGVGYPNPNRSHFESMDIWHTARLSAADRAVGHGWLGDAVTLNAPVAGPAAIHVGNDSLPVALRGRRCRTTSLANLADLKLTLPGLAGKGRVDTPSDSLAEYVQRSVSQAYASAEELAENTKRDTQANYPGSRLAQRLRIISEVIKSGSNSRIYYTSQGGYDTHASQSQTHANLLGTLSSSLKAFMNDLRDSGLQDRVLVIAFSEFGRRVAENASLGTDHGTAGPVLLAGSRLRERVYGEQPSLTNLDSGDLRFSRDFRDIYASILQDWLQLDLPPTLKGFGMGNRLIA